MQDCVDGVNGVGRVDVVEGVDAGLGEWRTV